MKQNRWLEVFLTAGVLAWLCAVRSTADERTTGAKFERAKSAIEITQLLDQLGDSRFAMREHATRELGKLGMSALPELKSAANSPNPEVRRRAQQLVERLAPPVTAAETGQIHQKPKVKIFR